MKPTIWEHFKGVLFHVFPHHAVSQLIYNLTRIRSPLVHRAIRAYIRYFDVDMSDAATGNIEDYECFDDFFTRALKREARPVFTDANAVVSPCDGGVCEYGRIEEGTLYQAKGQSYTVAELLGETNSAAGDANGHDAGNGGNRRGGNLSKRFSDGHACVIYLSPADYHRVHMPVSGRLSDMIYAPGRLFSVAPYARKVIPRLFARNDRVVSVFETGHGLAAIVMVGAVNVGCIETVWHGVVTPHRVSNERVRYSDGTQPVELAQGEEMGRFHMGSTVILLFESPRLQWDKNTMKTDGKIRVGELIARLDAGDNDCSSNPDDNPARK